MSRNIQFSLLFFIFGFSHFLIAQDVKSDSLLILEHVHSFEVPTVQKHSVRIQRSYNPLKVLLYFSMYFYQTVFSPQISAGCEFDRSCSNFSLTAIQEFGIIKGVSLSADRLMRCNGQAQVETEGHLINHSNGKTIDEPSMYRFK